ncbi:MAG: (d)CMP kinase [Fimbriimonadales bacterium]
MQIDAIAIDGPAGAGKSTVSKMVAKRLGFAFLDTGAMYRCVALEAIRIGVDFHDEQRVTEIADKIEIRFEPGDPQRVFLNDNEVTNEIRTQQVGEGASIVSTFVDVRASLVRRQKQISERGKVVMEGRDTTTVVCPLAKVKIFLTASAEERARRRTLELEQRGEEASYSTILREIIERDERDTERANSPLMVAPGAVVINTDDLTIQDVVEQIVAVYHNSESA